MHANWANLLGIQVLGMPMVPV